MFCKDFKEKFLVFNKTLCCQWWTVTKYLHCKVFFKYWVFLLHYIHV